jgi:hypothetical protein
MKVFEIFFDDLNDDTKKQLVEFLGGENGNYDVVPLITIEMEVED